MALQEQWVWGLLSRSWDHAYQQLQTGLSNLSRLYKLYQQQTETRLLVLEADAVVGRISASGATSINSTTAANLAGLSTTITPTQVVTALVIGVFDVSPTAYPSGVTSVLVIELKVNGVAQSAQVIFAPAAVNERFTATQTWVIPMVANTAYALQATGRVNIAGNTYSVAATHSGISAVLLG